MMNDITRDAVVHFTRARSAEQRSNAMKESIHYKV